MAKAKAEEVTVEETVVVAVDEVSTVVLNEAVPEKEAPGHGSRDFKKSR